ncbi:MAG: response regulator transcription factor [Pseudonocardia sp.]
MPDGPDSAPVVLVVEDDPRIASFVTRALSASGFAVEWVSTGGEALARVEGGGVAVQILDLGLPDMDGLDVLRSLRARGDDLPVIVVTARNDQADRETALSLGVVAYLRKPFPLGELLGTVRTCAADPAGRRGS